MHRYLAQFISAAILRTAVEMNTSSDGPSEIIDGFLWIGNAGDSANVWILSRLGITHVINLSPCINFFEDAAQAVTMLESMPLLKQKLVDFLNLKTYSLPKYLKLNVRDAEDEPLIPKHIETVKQFLNEPSEQPKRILVHCQGIY
jgi:hypothetical protein